MTSKINRDALWEAVGAMLKDSGADGDRKRNFTESVELQVSFIQLFWKHSPHPGISCASLKISTYFSLTFTQGSYFLKKYARG